MKNTIRVLITVLTYPHPSEKYEELVCTAGITENGEWVRLYPIDLRYLSTDKQFKKYQWVEIDVDESGHENDIRKESRRPDRNSIRIVSPVISSDNCWALRKDIVDMVPNKTLNQLKREYNIDYTSLGVVKPTKVLDLEITKTDEKWKPRQEQLIKQCLLFENRKKLRKIPFTFKYVFECEDSEKPHTASLKDWEVGALWLKEVVRLGDEQAAAQSVKRKFLDEVCRQDKDTRFFMGTILPYNSWFVLGVFWPPRVDQLQLF